MSCHNIDKISSVQKDSKLLGTLEKGVLENEIMLSGNAMRQILA